jgi:hypothetical protein
MSSNKKSFQKVVTSTKDIPVAFFEMTGQRPSGFVQEGTERSADPNQLTAPEILKIRSTSHYFKNTKNGLERVDIRYILGVNTIVVAEQDAKKHLFNPRRDVIILRKGMITVAREGNTTGLYDYLHKCSYNESNPERDTAVDIRFREVVPSKAEVDDNELLFAQAEAVNLVKALVTKNGEAYVYDEEKLNAYCTLWQVVADSPAAKINALIANAKLKPVEFIEKSKAYDQRFQMELVQAEELQLIKYGQTTVEYVQKSEVILSFTGAFLSKDVKRERLAAYFQSADGAIAYQRFLIELETIKGKRVNN